jgi:AsmA protein
MAGDAAEAVRIAKWTAIILGSLVLLLAAAAFVLTSVVDPNRYRGKIEGIVADLAGRPFVIEGNLELTWYPWLGVRTGAAHLDNLPGVPGPPIAEWQSIAVAAKVVPLLRGEIVAERIMLRGPHIYIRRDAQGHGNWEDLGLRKVAATSAGTTAGTASLAGPTGIEASARSDGMAASAGATPSSPASHGSPTSRGHARTQLLQIAGIEIRDGVVDYVDDATGLRATLSGLELDVGEWVAGRPLPVHTRFLARTQSLPPAGVWVQVDAPELAIRTEPLAVAAPKVSLQVGNARLEGDVAYEHAPGQAIEHSTEQTTEQTGERDIRVQTTNSKAADTRVRAHGTVAVHSPSVRELASELGLNQTMPHDPTTLGPLELTTAWSYDAGLIAAKPLALKLDGVSFNGWLERTAAPRAMWGFELHGDSIDLGRYINVDSANKKPFKLPVEALRAINANGSVIFDQAVLADTHMADVRLRLQTPEGKP